jgi:hypothetical protein
MPYEYTLSLWKFLCCYSFARTTSSLGERSSQTTKSHIARCYLSVYVFLLLWEFSLIFQNLGCQTICGLRWLAWGCGWGSCWVRDGVICGTSCCLFMPKDLIIFSQDFQEEGGRFCSCSTPSAGFKQRTCKPRVWHGHKMEGAWVLNHMEEGLPPFFF